MHKAFLNLNLHILDRQSQKPPAIAAIQHAYPLFFYQQNRNITAVYIFYIVRNPRLLSGLQKIQEALMSEYSLFGLYLDTISKQTLAYQRICPLCIYRTGAIHYLYASSPLTSIKSDSASTPAAALSFSP